MNLLRLFLACLLAPGVPAALLYLAQLVNGIRHREAVMAAGIIGFVSYAVAVIAGIPLGLAFRHRRVRSVWVHLAAGCLLGALGGIAFAAPALWPVRSSIEPSAAWGKLFGGVILGVPCGLVGGFSFWLIAAWSSGPKPAPRNS